MADQKDLLRGLALEKLPRFSYTPHKLETLCKLRISEGSPRVRSFPIFQETGLNL